MSPACMSAIFDGENGGATSPGVSATEIRVGVPVGTGFGSFGPTLPYQAIIRALFEYFNQRFELYGRRLVPVFVEGEASTATTARTQAAEVAAQGVFGAITSYMDWGSPQATLVQALTRSKIVTMTRNTAAWWSDRQLFDPSHPYLWSVFPSSEAQQANLGDFACTVLAGRPARFAGDPQLVGKTRRFGIIAAGEQLTPQVGILSDALAACLGQPTLRVEWAGTAGTTALQTGLARLQSDGATTVICVCADIGTLGSVLGTATPVGIRPEWILNPTPPYGDNDDEANIQSRRATHAPPMRVSAGPRLLPVQARPWFGPLASAATSLTSDATLARAVWGLAGYVYEQLLMLASGIQGAGPTLTPETFAAGLMATEFPNPGAGAAPSWQPSVGFGPGDHAFYSDYTIGWWSDEADALNYPISTKPKGSWCYLHQGARFRPGNYPAGADQLLFNRDVPCR